MTFFSRRTVAVYLILTAIIVVTLGFLGARIVREQAEAADASLRQQVPELVDQATARVAILERHLADLLIDNGRATPDDVRVAFGEIETIGARLAASTAVDVAAYDPALDGAITDFIAAVRRGAPLLTDLADPDRLDAARRHFQDVAARVDTLRLRGSRYAASFFRATHAAILHRFTYFIVAAFGLIVVVSLLLLTLSRQVLLLNGTNLRALSLARHLTTVREDLEHASRALERSNAELADQNRRLRDNEQILEERNYQFNAALDTMLEGLCMIAADGRLSIVNRRMLSLYRLDPDRVRPGIAMRDLVGDLIDGGRLPARDAETLLRHPDQPAGPGPRTYDLHLDGGATIVEVHEQPLAHGGWLVTHEDVTERRQTHLRIEHLASHDPLTGLPNRTRFNEALAAAVAAPDRPAAIMLVDLDRFKSVNDLHGHAAGDRLLELIAERLRAVLPPDCLAARLGGDEFAVLIRGHDVRARAEALADRLVRAARRPFDLGIAHVEIGVSAGIAVAPDDGRDARTLQRNADLALYAVKAARLNTFRFFDAEMSACEERRHALETELKTAVAVGGLTLHFQPIVAAGTARIVGAEALLRWTSPSRGAIAADEIIALAEETGLMGPLGDWILREAIATAAAWPEHLSLAVNLSARQFRHSGLIATVLAALDRHGFAASRLQLEVTETVLCEDDAGAAMADLRAHGVRLSLDDFGTGYASLSYLTRFPFDRIKIDKSFVRQAADRPDCRAIIDAVCGLAASLGLDTVAEGIETEAELDIVRAAGCGYGQGYYFGRPMPARDFLALVGGGHPDAVDWRRDAAG
jgi:diguanylate cyclase (GGDEF)-like protein